MANFPDSFTENPTYIHPTNVRPSDAEPFAQLERRGFVVVAGLRESDVADLSAIAGQEGVREYCPNDIAKRWTDIPTTEKQLAKDGGRGVFRLESLETHETAAFGWTGKSSEDERALLPMCENTFALRINETYRGQRLGRPFSRAIVAGSVALFKAKKIGLETWGSNTPAVRSYLGAGALLVTTQYDRRLTRVPELQDADGKVRDVRLYMQYPQSM
ncbi:MAG: hypothetical protein WC498_02505 [Candidatus Saccharimonadales bacterium]